MTPTVRSTPWRGCSSRLTSRPDRQGAARTAAGDPGLQDALAEVGAA